MASNSNIVTSETKPDTNQSSKYEDLISESRQPSSLDTIRNNDTITINKSNLSNSFEEEFSSNQNQLKKPENEITDLQSLKQQQPQQSTHSQQAVKVTSPFSDEVKSPLPINKDVRPALLSPKQLPVLDNRALGKNDDEFESIKAAIRPVSSQELENALDLLKYDIHKDVQTIIKEQIRQFDISRVSTFYLI